MNIHEYQAKALFRAAGIPAPDDAVAASPDEVARFKAGNKKLMGFFVGQVMKATQGKANPKQVNELLRKKLDS